MIRPAIHRTLSALAVLTLVSAFAAGTASAEGQQQTILDPTLKSSQAIVSNAVGPDAQGNHAFVAKHPHQSGKRILSMIGFFVPNAAM